MLSIETYLDTCRCTIAAVAPAVHACINICIPEYTSIYTQTNIRSCIQTCTVAVISLKMLETRPTVLSKKTYLVPAAPLLPLLLPPGGKDAPGSAPVTIEEGTKQGLALGARRDIILTCCVCI